MQARSRTSRTYAADDGVVRTELFAGPIHYRDSAGGWQPIDNTLVPAAAPYAFRNRANDYTLELPPVLGVVPVRVATEGRFVAFALEGASGVISAAGNSGRYVNALPGVEVAYRADPAGVKETITLASAAAASTFTFTITTSAGLTARETASAAIEFVDERGTPVFLLPRPSMIDANGASSNDVRFALGPAAEGFTLTLAAERAWLDAPERAWPVVIDPSIVQRTTKPGADQEAFISSAFPDVEFGWSTDFLDIGLNGSDKRRGLVGFTYIGDQLKRDDLVVQAKLWLHLDSATTANPARFDVHRATRAFNWNATWNRADQTTPWTTPGGDFDAAVEASKQIGNEPGWHSWDITDLVQRWTTGTQANYGFVVKQAAEDVQQTLRFHDSTYATLNDPLLPKLEIWYTHRPGLEARWTYHEQQLTDRSSLHVNVANGNLTIRNDDVRVAARGVDLELTRTFNSLPGGWFSFGVQELSGGTDVSLTSYENGNVVFTGPGKTVALFKPKAGGGFTSPSGINATLTRAGDGTHTLKYHRTGELLRFAADGRLTSHEDQNGNTIRFFYLANGMTDYILDTHGRRISFAYAGIPSLVTSITDSSGRLWRYDYPDGNLQSVTDPAGQITRYTYAATGPNGDTKLVRIQDPRGDLTEFTYLSDCAEWKTPCRVSSIKRITNPATGAGDTTTFSYTEGQSAPCTGSTDHGKTVVTDPRRNATTYCYDAELRVTKVVDPLGHSNSRTYSANSDVTSETNALGKTWTQGYDTSNNATSSQAPTGAGRTWSYDLAGPHPFYPKDGTDPQANQTNWRYDANGNLTEKSEGAAGQNPIRLTYNANGTLATATDAKSAVTRYSYDADGNLTSVDHPAPLGDITYTYDSLSRVRTETDGKGQTTTYTYDALDRITNVQFHDGSSVAYTYDGAGNRTQRVDSTGTSTYSYDALNRLTQEALPSGTTDYAYDAASNLISLTDAGGTVTYEYDAADRATALTEPGGARTTFAYDDNDNRTRTNYPNGISLCLGYDDAERLTSIVARRSNDCANGAIVTRFSYGYDRSGADSELRTSMSSQYEGEAAVATSYGYDGRNRLTSATGLGGSFSYAYDANGNVTSATENGQTRTFTHNAANQIMNSGYSHDGNGNQTAAPALTLIYNAKDQTVTINGNWSAPAFVDT